MPQVLCSVSNCHYWSEGNRCAADAIMIEIDEHAEAEFHAEFAGEAFDTQHKDEATKASNTCCHTFKPKDSGLN